jgi:hypothetical protein
MKSSLQQMMLPRGKNHSQLSSKQLFFATLTFKMIQKGKKDFGYKKENFFATWCYKASTIT